MDNEAERLRRRTAAYRGPTYAKTDGMTIARLLKRVQEDTAIFTDTSEVPPDLGPAHLRSRAAHYRQLAGRDVDPKRAKLFQDLAASFEKQATLRESRPPPKD